MKIRRGDILYADLGVQYQGSVQGGIRPVVVISNNMANKNSTVITVVPLTLKILKKQNLPTHVFVSAYLAEGLEKHSVALCEQVMSLDYDRIIENLGKVDEKTLARITEAVQVQVGVFDKYN
ncbi:MAG: type II toxin-antitoxin system PemK/MazF family toxin [Lachnospiraceae bacterium]|nr:type II toxin-antitoxin system PemK/MazF family toxin [Lachnospiraceae bacterium]